jgi:hypothetical protein
VIAASFEGHQDDLQGDQKDIHVRAALTRVLSGPHSPEVCTREQDGSQDFSTIRIKAVMMLQASG